MYSIVAENLTKKFGDFTSVDHINFQVKQGEIFGFLGGCGPLPVWLLWRAMM